MTEDTAWQLRIEGYDAPSEAGVEAALVVGNGFVGVRGGLEEGPAESIPRTFVAGLFDRIHAGPEPPPSLAAAPQLVTAPDWLAFDLHVDGERVHIEEGACVEQMRELNLRDGLLCRRLRLRSASGRETTLLVLRCAHLVDRQALLQRFTVRPENFDGRITLTVMLDGRRMRSRDEAPRLLTAVDATFSPAALLGRMPDGPAALAMAQRTALAGREGRVVPGARRTLLHRKHEIVDRWVWEARCGETYTLDSLVACHRSLDGVAPAAEASAHAEALARREMAPLLAEHRRRWHERWRDGDVQIDGDPEAQRAVRWSLYQLNSAVDPTDARVSIGARGLTGLSYHGHAFWDTEIYMLPYYVFTWPEAARTLLLYRYQTLPAARAKAASQGFRGALYAWESALGGAEVTPEETPGADGRPVRIYTGEQAHHISADIAYAVRQYVLAAGDEEFLLEAGAEILFETARFWASRIEEGADGAWHLRGVVGPDEYHDGVDDDAYTLGMARSNLESALWAEERLAAHPHRQRELHERIGLGADEPAQWRRLAARLLPRRTADGLVEQFHGCFQLHDLDPERVMAEQPGAPSAQAVLGVAGVRGTQIIKQADVVLLTALLEDQFSREEIARSFAYYERRCDHASSLSPGPHCLVAARLGLSEIARRYFERAALLDLRDRCAHAAEGVHLGNCGAVWQAVVLGVAGMRLHEEGVAFDPHLPPGWRELRFSVRWHGARLAVEVDGTRGELRLASQGPGAVPVRLRDGAWQHVQPGAALRFSLAAVAERSEA